MWPHLNPLPVVFTPRSVVSLLRTTCFLQLCLLRFLCSSLISSVNPVQWGWREFSYSKKDSTATYLGGNNLPVPLSNPQIFLSIRGLYGSKEQTLGNPNPTCTPDLKGTGELDSKNSQAAVELYHMSYFAAVSTTNETRFTSTVFVWQQKCKRRMSWNRICRAKYCEGYVSLCRLGGLTLKIKGVSVIETNWFVQHVVQPHLKAKVYVHLNNWVTVRGRPVSWYLNVMQKRNQFSIIRLGDKRNQISPARVLLVNADFLAMYSDSQVSKRSHVQDKRLQTGKVNIWLFDEFTDFCTVRKSSLLWLSLLVHWKIVGRGSPQFWRGKRYRGRGLQILLTAQQAPEAYGHVITPLLCFFIVCSSDIVVPLLPPFFSPETHNLPKQPPLAQAVGQAAQCLAIMARTGSGSCAFASVDDYLH